MLRLISEGQSLNLNIGNSRFKIQNSINLAHFSNVSKIAHVSSKVNIPDPFIPGGNLPNLDHLPKNMRLIGLYHVLACIGLLKIR